MKTRFYFLFFILLLSASCGGSTTSSNQTDQSENPNTDTGGLTETPQENPGSDSTGNSTVDETGSGTAGDVGGGENTDSSSSDSGSAETTGSQGSGESGGDSTGDSTGDSSSSDSGSSDSGSSSSDGAGTSAESDGAGVSGGLTGSDVSDGSTTSGDTGGDSTAGDTTTGGEATTGGDTTSGEGSTTSGDSTGGSGFLAPDLDPTVSTTLGAATEFLYTGDNPIQTGVEEGTIDVTRVAVIRGKVFERDGDVLSGVTVTILDHDEYGSTQSREDGMFDMAVNGGGYLTVVYKKEGYISVHRKLDTPWQDYVWAEDVAMVAYDSEVTEIDLSGGTTSLQIAQGSESTDEDGTRTATLLFPVGTTATMTLDDGSIETLSTLNIRATEYTVGEDGPAAMPASLPANSAYTYAVELSVDEAVLAEATTVSFNQPVYFYVENFLNFPVGEAVPTGYYDRELSAWVPSESGVIIEILGDLDGDGMAEIDSDGDDSADDAATLSDLGFTDEERTTLVSKYTTGQTLWRVPMEHLTPWDCNWGFGPPDDAEVPNQSSHDDQIKNEDSPCEQPGSIIECQNQVLGERISLAGTSYTLNYRNGRVPGYKVNSTLNIQVTNDSIPASLKHILLEITVAGKLFEIKLPAETNQTYQFEWDGLDAYERHVSGAQAVKVRIGYVYTGAYESTNRFGFNGNGAEISGSRARQEIALWQTYTTQIVVLNQKSLGLGGWSLSPHHMLDVIGLVAYFGDGEKRSSTSLTHIIKTVAGYIGSTGYTGDGGPATSAGVGASSVVVDAEGNIFIGDISYGVVRKVDGNGIITTVVGTGVYGCDLGSGLATSQHLTFPSSLAVDGKGNLYIGDSYCDLVSKVDKNGVMTVIAGSGRGSGYTGDGGLATSAGIDQPEGLAVDDEGNVYIADAANHAVRKVDTSGIITTVAGTGVSGFAYDYGWVVAKEARLRAPTGVDVDSEGNLYIADYGNYVIHKVDTSGMMKIVAGNASRGYEGDGGLATSAKLNYLQDVKVDSEGNLYIADWYNSIIRKVDSTGVITTIAGQVGIYGNSESGVLAKNAKLSFPDSIALDNKQNLLIASGNVVQKITKVYPEFSNTDIVISSEDGTELYQFNLYGQHQSTVDTLTGTTLYTFGYDSNNLLETITDEDGNVTTIHHDSDGNPTSIVGPYGQTTTLEVDENGYLKTVTNAAGESYSMTYDENGLLQTFANPKGYSSSFEYDELGYLTKDTNAANNAQTLSRESTEDGYEVTHTSPEGSTSIYKVETDSSGEKIWTNTLPDGTQSTTTFGTDGSKTTTSPDGTTTKIVSGPDPRFGMEAPITESMSVATPAGLTYESSLERSVTLSDDEDLLSLITQEDVVTINGKTYTSVYDATTYEQETTSPKSRKAVSTFDSKGKLLKTQIGTTLEPTSYTYDSNGRLSTITVGTTDPKVTTFTYYSDEGSSKGLLKTITDPLSQITLFEYDDAGRVVSQTSSDGKIISYTYDENGNLTSITPPSQPEHTFNYNNLDLGSSYVAPDISLSSRTTEYSYNKDKQLDLITRPDGKTIDYIYDAAGRIATLDADGDTYAYAYSSTTGLLTSISDPSGGSLAFTYDGKLLLTSTLTGDVTGSIGFTYNDDFWITKETINGTTNISFEYDDDGLLTKAGDLSLTRSSDHGLVTGTTLSNITSSITYTEIGELKSEDFSYSGSSIHSATYTRDNLGRITDKTVINGATTIPYTYSYDAAGRLETAMYVSSTTTYTYDDNGNRLTKTKDGATTTATYDDQDRLLTYGDNTYTYTDNGELLTKTNTDGTTTYTYDVLGNLKSVALPDGTEIEYVIDATNRRVGKKKDGALTQGFIYKDQLKPIAELDGTNNIVSTFIYASKSNVPDYMVKSGTMYRIISDQLGSPILVVNASTGTIEQEITYDEFGNILTDSNPGFQPFGFAGGIYDQDAKLTRFGARDYDAETGRWTAKDPIGFNGGDTNLYGYVFNDPVNAIDPMGLWTGELGFAGNLQIGIVNFNGAVGIVFDGHGNVAYYYTRGGGVGVGMGVVGGFSGGWSNGDSISDFADLFSSTNVSLGAVVDGSLETFFGPGSKGQVVSGNSVTIGPGVGVGYSGGVTYTELEPTSWINVLLQLPPNFDFKKIDALKGCPLLK